MHKVLYRTYRPETLDEIWGQKHIVRILKNQIAADRVSHAYLFCGTRGTGKTTVARALAKGINCTDENPQSRPCGKCSICTAIKNGTLMDVVEIDAASNNGVDNIRDLRESVQYPPVTARKKVYIIDEVHMLSASAFNALLKTLEEPPEYVVFILATTEPQKVPATILSRCMRLDFRRVPEREIADGMRRICGEEGVEIEESALRVIAANADGSVRDGLSILDRCIASGAGKITRDEVLDFLGTSGEEVFTALTDSVRFGDTSQALRIIDKALADGKEIRQFMKDWMIHYRNLLIGKFVRDPEDLLNMSCENAQNICSQAELMELEEINTAILELSKTLNDAMWSTQPRVLLELCAVKLSAPSMPKSDIEKKIRLIAETNRKALADAVENGMFDSEKVLNDEAEGGMFNSGKAVNDASESGVFGNENENKNKNTFQNTDEHRAASARDQVFDDIPPGEADLDEYGADSAENSNSETGKTAAAEQSSAGENTETDCKKPDEIWNEVFEKAETIQGSSNLIMTGAFLKEITDKEFVVEAKNGIIKGHIENNSELLRSLMEECTGRKLALKCVVHNENHKPEGKKNLDDTVAAVEKIIAAPVSIEN